MSPKLINDGVSRFDSSFMTTSMPFRRANATTFDFDPKSIPATDMIFLFLFFSLAFFLRFFSGVFASFPFFPLVWTESIVSVPRSKRDTKPQKTTTGREREREQRERDRRLWEHHFMYKGEKREEERKSALNKRLSSLCAAKKERERKQRVRLLLLLLQLPSGFITLNETAILR